MIETTLQSTNEKNNTISIPAMVYNFNVEVFCFFIFIIVSVLKIKRLRYESIFIKRHGLMKILSYCKYLSCNTN